jgi:hypothetical protein
MGFIDEYFSDWKKKTVTFEAEGSTPNAAGQPVKGWNILKSGVKVNWWVSTSRETRESDKFVDKVKGKALLDFSEGVSPTTGARMVEGSTVYLITGVDNMAGFDDFYVLDWIRDI